MAALSIRAYKFKMMLSSLLSRIGNLWANQSIRPHKDEQRLDAVLHYPLKAASIPIVDIELLLERQISKIRQIERDVGLIHQGCEFNFVDLVESTIRSYIGYCHLIPASEMDHHQYIGGLLEHSLDVSIKALQNAMSYMLDEMGLIDEDQARRPRYEFAAWVCGLLHDSGKIISNVQVIGSNGDIWRPLNESIFDWAKRCDITEYTVVHQKERLNRDHETNSVHFLPLVLNESAKNYLLGSHDDLYSMITQTLVHYHSYKGYLFNAVRKADSDSTYEDYARVWLHDSSRQKSITMGVVNAMRSLYLNWVVNKPGADLFVFNGLVFIAADRPINEVIKKCIDYGIKLPTSSKALISILLDKRILSMVSDKSTYASLYLGEFTEEDVKQFTEFKNGPLSKVSPVSVIMVEWPNFVIGDNPIPSNVLGAIRYNTAKSSNVYQIYNREGHKLVMPSELQSNTANAEELQSAAHGMVKASSEIPFEQQPTNINDELPQANHKANSTVESQPESVQPKQKAKPKAKASPKPEGLIPAVEKSSPKPDTTTPDAAILSSGTDTTTESLVQNETSTSEMDSRPSALNPEYPWVIKNRMLKPVDAALLALMQSANQHYLWMEGESVCVDTDFLIQHTNQSLPQLLNALNYLKLIKKNDQKKDASVLMKDGKKVTYILLSDEVGIHFCTVVPTVEIENENQFNSLELNNEKDVANGQEKPNSQIEIIEDKSTKTDKSLEVVKTDEPTAADDYGDPHNVRRAEDEWDMPYRELLAELQKGCPELTTSQLTKFCRAQGVKANISNEGEITAKMTEVQLDELKCKLRENNE
ncbi:MobH family relaxase [Shewanella xiamenensis]|uniref:MobH family relaxase n=1 Tax=Shewanella xiamenensis TaxID=332186 RepID=UPI002E7B82D3|nr:MobH family relaxase [Shewanella xiamenensis]